MVGGFAQSATDVYLAVRRVRNDVIMLFRAMAGQHTWCVRRDIRLFLRLGGRRGDIEECAGHRDALGTVGGGEEPVVADAVEALGQHVAAGSA